MSAGTDSEARNWAMFCHLAGLAMFLAVPGANIIGPLIVWLMKREQFPLVDREGKSSINFQISMTIYMIVCAITVVGLILIPVVVLLDLILLIIATVKTSSGESFKYPLTIRFVK